MHLYRVEIDLLRGDIEAAQRRQQQIRDLIGHVGNFDRSREAAQRTAELALWARPAGRGAGGGATGGRAGRGLAVGIFCGRLLAAGMRACADLAELARARRDESAAEAAVAAGDALAAAVAEMTINPFADHPFVAAIPAERATWDAERSRLAGSSDPVAWSAAVKAWADLRWPHRAGYAGGGTPKRCWTRAGRARRPPPCEPPPRRPRVTRRCWPRSASWPGAPGSRSGTSAGQRRARFRPRPGPRAGTG